MYLASATQSEIRITLDVMVDAINALDDETLDVRDRFFVAGFTRAEKASQASVDRLRDRLADLAPLVLSLPDLSLAEASAKVNEELTELSISPWIVDHDGVGAHIHWTPTTATFDDQAFADVVMALTQELCDNDTIRFGRCDAETCERLFYDATRNRSRRFCSDTRCASRTHTADHRARKREG